MVRTAHGTAHGTHGPWYGQLRVFLQLLIPRPAVEFHAVDVQLSQALMYAAAGLHSHVVLSSLFVTSVHSPVLGLHLSSLQEFGGSGHGGFSRSHFMVALFNT
jgi:hypothetical protein